MDLGEGCEEGMTLRLRLAEAELEAKDQISITGSETSNVLVRFERSTTGDSGAEIGAAIAGAQVEQARPLIQDGEMQFLLSLIAIATVGLLALIAFRSTSRSANTSSREAELLAKVLVEGMVLTLAIIAIIVLGASAKLTSEGLVSILAAIVGYAAGRSSNNSPA